MGHPHGDLGHSRRVWLIFRTELLQRRNCIAVGKDDTQQPVLATEAGGVWAAPLRSRALRRFRLLSAVSCTDATSCTAVGSDGGGEPMYDVDSAGVWGAPTEVTGAEGGSGSLLGVSCAKTTDCTAVGGGGDGDPIYARETGGRGARSPRSRAPTPPRAPLRA